MAEQANLPSYLKTKWSRSFGERESAADSVEKAGLKEAERQLEKGA